MLCLVAFFVLSGCRTGWGAFDDVMLGEPDVATQQVPPAPAKKAAKPTRSASFAKPRQEKPGYPQTTGTQMAMAVPPVQPSQPVVDPQPMTAGKIQVALLLPLSGKNAPLGQAMLNAAQLAVFDMAPPNFELMPRDTGKSAENAARDAIASGAQLLIGPLFAGDVLAVKPVVQTSNINMLALSTDVSLAEPGVYVMGFAPSAQVERVVAYAASKGLHRFAAVLPTNAYGKLVQKAFEEAVRKEHGTLVAAESPARIQALAEKRDQIDALLLPFGGEDLRQIITALAANGINGGKIRFLGTGLWDEPGLGSRSPDLVGGWYAASEPAARESFVNNYEKAYDHEPPRLATLTYDATALAAVLASRGGNYDRTALTNPSGFTGLDGIFRLTWEGQAERGLAVNEITPSGSVVIDPSPSSFQGVP